MKYYDAFMQQKEKIKKAVLGNEEEQIQDLKHQLAEKDKEIEELKTDNNQYKVWHKLQKEQIEKLKTELETYRPTKLKGNGQCVCSVCRQRNWTDWCIKYDGKIYCDKCFKQVKTRDDNIRHQVCEEIREYVNNYFTITKNDHAYSYFMSKLDQIEGESK